jgi:predicted RNA-binding Zn-ribbon protein involved in translation (DUF1610 family)
MEIINCNQCGQVVRPDKQTVEYTIKEENGTRIYVLSKISFTFTCPNCGIRMQDEPLPAS